jgi:hypothetical protein
MGRFRRAILLVIPVKEYRNVFFVDFRKATIFFYQGKLLLGAAIELAFIPQEPGQ